jgi:hypothetical protein
LAVAELGNLTARIVLPPSRMSTVKIRAGSLFRNPHRRNWAAGARFGDLVIGFPPSSTKQPDRSQNVHRQSGIATCKKPASGCKVETGLSSNKEWFR